VFWHKFAGAHSAYINETNFSPDPAAAVAS